MRPRSDLALGFLSLAAFLLVWPLTLQKPGLPYSMKADEPAYYLMARSLWEDHDLRCEPKDLLRVTDDFFRDADNLILLTTDAWETAYFGKPWFASLLAAPLVAAFGANGFLALNMLLFLLSLRMAWAFLAGENGEALGLLLALGFFFLSAAWQYVYWMQPETSTLFFVTLALFLTFREPRRLAGARWWIVGLALGPVISAKPPYLVVLLPALVGALASRQWRRLLTLLLATAISAGAIACAQQALTGTWSPYLGAFRRSFNIHTPNHMPTAGARQQLLQALEEARAATLVPLDDVTSMSEWKRRHQAGTDWSWVFSKVRVPLDRVRVDIRTYLVGRHTGLFVFYPFLLVALVLFWSGGGFRDPRRWAILAGFGLYTAFLLGWNFQNYHGGGGFVGNRYWAPLYPAALFLIARIRPIAALPLGVLLASLFLGQVLFHPLGVPVDEPTLQAYTRAKPFRWLPFEYNLAKEIPGYRGLRMAGAWFTGREDRIAVNQSWVTIRGSEPAELFLTRFEPTPDAVFALRNWAPGNRVTLRAGPVAESVVFPDAPPPPGGASALVHLDLRQPHDRVRLFSWSPGDHWFWRFEIDPEQAARPSWWGEGSTELVGVQLSYLGTRERLARDVYGIEWLEAAPPERVEAGKPFHLLVRFLNASAEAWTRDSAARVKLAYRWRDAAGREVEAAPARTDLAGDLAPGEGQRQHMEVVAPALPGTWTLVLEPVYEHVRWFGDVDPATRRSLEVCVDPPLSPSGS